MTSEQYTVVPDARSPFATGRIITSKDIGWSSVNDGVVATLTQDENNWSDPLELRADIEHTVESFPVLGGILVFNPSMGSEPAEATIPTLATLNAFGQEVFAGLPTAGIKLVQSKPNIENSAGHTLVEQYVAHLRRRQLVASSQPKHHLHDILFHALGAMATEEKEFIVFETLAAAGDAIREEFGPQTHASYTARLGTAFDMHSFSYMGLWASKTLPDGCMATLSYDYSDKKGNSISPALPTKVLTQSQRVVDAYRADPTTSTGGSREDYYGEIQKRLKGKPWRPPNYRLPKHRELPKLPKPYPVRTRRAPF